jgi:hypothetical protein
MAKHPIVLPEEFSNQDAKPLEHAVADAVAMPAIDLRQLVDVEHHERQGEREALRALHFGRQQLEQSASESFAVISFERLRSAVREYRDAVADDGVRTLEQDAANVRAHVGRGVAAVIVVRCWLRP